MAEIKAIVYESNTGFTKEYAELLSKEIGIPAISQNKGISFFAKRDSVIFMGWICAGKINGLRLANIRYNTSIIVGIGMSRPTEDVICNLYKENSIEAPLFYLQGGVNFNKLKGLYKIMLSMISKSTITAAKKKNTLTDDEREILELLKNGGSFVDVKNLKDIIEKYNELKIENNSSPNT